jgi:hypothetical protein
MRKIYWNITASIGLIVCSQAASAALDSGATTFAGHSVQRNVLQQQRLAQAGAPTPSTTPPPADSKAPSEPSAPAVASPPGTVTVTAVKSAPSVPGCALHYLAAEVSGKLKGRKWKEFRQEECGASEVSAVFPTAIAPKYAGEKPDKARTLTCADQFNANKADKAANANGGLKWIEKSGGYYSECIVRLKG